MSTRTSHLGGTPEKAYTNTVLGMYRNQVRLGGGMLDRPIDDELALPCRAFGPDLWFADTPAGVDQAKRLCGLCPIRVKCLAGALLRGEPCGVWGGEIFENGEVIPFKRPRGRPPRKRPDRGVERVA
jgi:WhiB family redox-sensing transcriptional regulator